MQCEKEKENNYNNSNDNNINDMSGHTCEDVFRYFLFILMQ